jgi:hypothetical protein
MPLWYPQYPAKHWVDAGFLAILISAGDRTPDR